MTEVNLNLFTLSAYDSVVIDLPDFSVPAEKVQQEMERIASRHAQYETVEPHALLPDDCIYADISTSENGKPFPGMTHDGINIQLGIGQMPSEFELGMLGGKVGDLVTIEYDGPDMGEPDKDGGRSTAHLVSTVRVLELRRSVVPEITDGWVASNIALADTVADFRFRTERRLSDAKRHDYLQQVPDLVTVRLGNRLMGRVPDELIERVSHQLSVEFDRFLKDHDVARGEYLDSQSLTEYSFESQLIDDARERVSQDIALMLYANHEGIVVNDDDLNAVFAQPTPEKTYEARMQVEQAGNISNMRDLARRAKASEEATRKAIYKDVAGKVDDGFAHEIVKLLEKRRLVRKHIAAEPMKMRLNDETHAEIGCGRR